MQPWLTDLFNSIDNKDTNKFIAFLTDNASFKFANAPAALGKENIRQAVDYFFSAVKAIRHDVKDAWEVNDVVICEGQVTYTRHDNTEATFPFANILRLKNKLIADYRIYVDNSTLFA